MSVDKECRNRYVNEGNKFVSSGPNLTGDTAFTIRNVALMSFGWSRLKY